MPFSTSVCRTAAVRKVEGACRLSCSCGPGQWPGRDVDGQENGAEGPTAFGSGEKRNHPWADWQARSSLEPSAHQAITPGPCRGWGRHRLAHIRAQRETLRRGRKKRRSTERAWCGSQRSYLQVPRPGTAGRDAHTDQEGVARWASRRACGGVRDRGHAAEGGHGSRGTGAVRSLCGRYGAGARRRAWSCRIRLAACLCSPGSGCTTRTGRSCRCAGAWVRRTAGMPALGEP